MANRFKKAAESRMLASEPHTENLPSEAAEIKEEALPREVFIPEQAKAEEAKAAPLKHTETTAINMRVPKAMHDALRMHYANTGEKMTAYIKRLVEADMGLKF